MIGRNRLIPFALVVGALGPSSAVGQLNLSVLSTRDLYTLGRQKAEAVNDRCVGGLDAYLESVAYLYAYQQAASRDGSLRSNPEFARTFLSQFDAVLRRAQMCLKAYPQISRASMRDDGTGYREAPVAPPPGVDLPEVAPRGDGAGSHGLTVEPKVVVLGPGGSAQFTVSIGGQVTGLPPVTWSATGGSVSQGYFTAGSAAGTYRVLVAGGGEVDTAFVAVAGGDAVATDAQGRTIPQLLAAIDQLEQDRARLQAEVQRLGGQAAAQPSAPTEYRVQSSATGREWHVDGSGDNLLSTRYQPKDDFTRFSLEPLPNGSYRIRVKGNGKYLYAYSESGNFLVISVPADVAVDDHSSFQLFANADGSYRIRNLATQRFLRDDGDLDGLISSRSTLDDGSTFFRLVP